MQQNLNNNKIEDSLFVTVLNRCVLHWPLYTIFITISISIAVVYFKCAPIIYQANALLIIKDEKKGNEDSKLLESLNLMSAKKIIENEIEILQSRTIIEKVVSNLNLYVPIFVEDGFNNISAYKQSPITIELLHPEIIKFSVDNIKFKFIRTSNSIELDRKHSYPVNQWVKTIYGVMKFNYNPLYDYNDSAFFFKILSKEDATNNILSNLKITATNKLSSIINLQYKDASPLLAEDVLNDIIQSYNYIISHEKNALALNTLSFIDKRLHIISHDLDEIESRIQQYKGKRQAVDISTQGQLFLQNVSMNNQQLSDIEMKISIIDDLESVISKKNGATIVLPSTLGAIDPNLSQLVSTLNNYDFDYQKLKITVADNNPILVSLVDQINITRNRIKDNISSYRKSLITNKNSLYSTNNSYNTYLQSIPSKEQDLLEISRDKQIKTDIYAFLLQKKEESEIAYASTITNNSVISKAHASKNPVSPNNLIVLGSLIFAIFGVPIGVVGVRDAFNTSVRYRKDIERLMNFPIIGEIAQHHWNVQNVLQLGVNTPNYESFRKLRYSLTNRGIGLKNKKLLVTSSISGEGKSYIATNLAISFANVGKKVVLLDFDFQKRALSHYFNLQSEYGLTDYLSGYVIEEDIIQHPKNFSNISLIPAGNIIANTTSLLENGNISDLLEYLEKNFDLIILDSSPMIHVADAYLLSAYCDTTLYVIKHGYSPKNIIESFNSNEDSNLLKDVVILYNGVNNKDAWKYGNYGVLNNYSNSIYSNKNKNIKLLN